MQTPQFASQGRQATSTSANGTRQKSLRESSARLPERVFNRTKPKSSFTAAGVVTNNLNEEGEYRAFSPERLNAGDLDLTDITYFLTRKTITIYGGDSNSAEGFVFLHVALTSIV